MLQDADGETALHKARKQVHCRRCSSILLQEDSPVIYALELETLLLDAPGDGRTQQKFVMRRSCSDRPSASHNLRRPVAHTTMWLHGRVTQR